MLQLPPLQPLDEGQRTTSRLLRSQPRLTDQIPDTLQKQSYYTKTLQKQSYYTKTLQKQSYYTNCNSSAFQHCIVQMPLHFEK